MAEKQKTSYMKELTKGFLKENPVLRLVLGTCPTLATSTSVVNGIGMGIAATIVLICSNIAISALRKVIPEKARIPAYIVIIASFVTVVQMLVKAFVPALDASLGVFLPLIVVNCIILGRAEAYASKNPVLLSAIDGLGMGIGFTAALFLMGTIREIIGAGTFLAGIDTMLGAYIDLGTFTGFDFTDELAEIGFSPMTLFILPAGGFFVFGMLMALANKLAERNGLKSATLNGCSGCPHAAFCKQFTEDGECTAENEPETKEEAPSVPVSTAETKKNEQKKAEEKTAPVQEEKTVQAVDEKTEKEEKPEKEEKTDKNGKMEVKLIDEPSDTEEKSEEKKEEIPEKTEKKLEEKVTEKAEEKPEDSISAPAKNSYSPQKKKNRKKKKKELPKTDALEPVPEVIPEFIKRDIEKKKAQEENKE